MNIDNKTFKNYENEKWLWKGKEIPLKHMDTNMLDCCLRFAKKYPEGELLFGKDKYYLINAIKKVIEIKSKKDINIAIAKIEEHRVLKANIKISKAYSMFRNNTILGKIKLLEYKLKNK